MFKPRNNIFIYDTSKGFGRFILKNYGDHFNFELCVNSEQLSDFDLFKFNISIFIINSEIDLLNLIAVRNNVQHVLIGSSNPKNYDILKLINGVEILKLHETKNNILERVLSFIKKNLIEDSFF